MEARGGHLRYVDGLRALAVLSVIFYHAICGASWAGPWLAARMQADPTWWFATLASKGTHGVDLFFVISGFCLSYPSLARLRNQGTTRFDVRDFLAKRVVRILPPYYVAIAVLAAIFLIVRGLGLPAPSMIGDGASPLALLQQALLLDRGVPYLNNAFWTLAIEFRWYLAFPLLLALYVRAPRAFFTVIAACVIAYNFTRLRAIDIATLPAFMLGIVAADWQIRPHRFAKYAIPLLLVSIDVALLLEPFSAAPSRFGGADEVGFYVQTNLGWQLVAFFFVVVAGRAAAVRRVLEWPVFVAIGACAYGIYLGHMPIIALWNERGGAHLGALANTASAVVLALATGIVFSYLAERPFLSSGIRTWMLRTLARPLERIFDVLGLPGSFALHSRLATAEPAEDLQAFAKRRKRA